MILVIELSEKSIAFDTYMQIIDGTAELIIDDKVISVQLGGGLIIPADAQHSFTADEQFKMITTVIKSGYEKWKRLLNINEELKYSKNEKSK